MSKDNKKPQVMIVGSFHMASSNDIHNDNVEDILSSKRQGEISEVIRKLKYFSPTKIALEVVTEKDSYINTTYSSYIDGSYQLKINESEQIGFKLASELSHEKIYAIDWMEVGVGTRGCGEVYQWAQENQPELYNELNGIGFTDISSSETILDMYKLCNHPDSIKKSHEFHLNLARIGKIREYIGIDWLIWWYQRNLILFSNICRLATDKNERILVLIGSAHVHLLKQFLEESGQVEVIDVNTFLQ